MTNEISSQITSTVQTQTRKPDPVSRPASGQVDSASNRQNVADNDPVSSVGVTGQGSDQAASVPELQQAVSDINDYVQSVNRELQFRVDEALPLGRTVVTVIDADTEETIREFPSEEALALAHRLKEQANEEAQAQIEGLIISARA